MKETTKKQLKFVTRENLTPKEAVAFLKADMQIRSFQDNIKAVCPVNDVEKQLAEGLCALEAQELTAAQRETIHKKVKNWMRGKNTPADREDVFKICFALELDLEKSEKLLSRLTSKAFTTETAGYSNAQKIVKKYWPGTRSIKAMKARTEDINRKTLLLLYIATGGIWNENYQEIDETYVSPDEFLEAHCKRMNHMLKACGMSPMDSRNMFDYLVLYCLRPEDTVFISGRMEELLAELFVVSE